jgi:predicted permease
MSPLAKPPRWVEIPLERLLGGGLWARAALGDLAEAYHRRLRTRGRAWCDLWYLGQALSLVLHRTLGDDGSPRARGDLASDVRWALRVSVRRPLLSVGVVTTLALGLGANLAVFSVIDGTFRASSWWSGAERTLLIWPGHTFSRGQLSIFDERSGAFQALGAYRLDALTVAIGSGGTESVAGVTLSPELFSALRVQPTLGRGFEPDDARPGGEATVIVSEGFWRRALGGDPGALGRRVEVNGVPHTIVGVQGRGGHAPGTQTDLWVPLVMDPYDPDFWPEHDLTVVGVLREGATPPDGQSDLRALGTTLSGLFPFFYRPDYLQDGTVTVAAAHERGLVRTPLFLLLGATVLLLVVAALNVGNMLLARSLERRAELAVRRALGAARGRIVRQLVTEGALVAFLGTGLALALARPAAKFVAGLFPTEVAVVRSEWTTPAVWAFLAGTAFLSWVIVAGIPVLAFLLGDGRSVRARIRARSTAPGSLVVAQSALATVLLVEAVLLVGSVANLRRIPLGFRSASVLAADVAPPADFTSDRARLRRFQEAAVERARSLPGVDAAGMTAAVPLEDLPPSTPVNPEGSEVDVSQAIQASRLAVDSGFFETLGVRLESGRLLGSTERGQEPTAVVINRALAERLWPGEDPVGRRIAIDPHAWDRFVPIVGVVADVRAETLVDPPRPTVFISLFERAERATTLLVRGSADGGRLGPALRRAVTEADAAVPTGAIRPMDAVVRDAFGAAWVTMGLLTLLALLATVLGSFGIHAVLSHHVVRQRRDLGVRMALGADGGRLIRRVLRAGLGSAALGVGIGCFAAAVCAPLLQSLLFGVSTLEPTAFLLPALGVLVAATLASLVPAVRAGSLAPADVLREE